uniref:transposase n=1 Tax=Kriegella aquimaris TaxID=192904 RepID=UPI001FE01CE1|nr:transposase [Kriegella aquimaris]
MGLRKINTIELEQANKVMHLAAIAYNIKKYLKFVEKRSKIGEDRLALSAFVENSFAYVFGAFTKQ